MCFWRPLAANGIQMCFRRGEQVTARHDTELSLPIGLLGHWLGFVMSPEPMDSPV